MHLILVFIVIMSVFSNVEGAGLFDIFLDNIEKFNKANGLPPPIRPPTTRASNKSTTMRPLTELEKKLEAIKKTCLKEEDYEEMSGHILKYYRIMYSLYEDLMKVAVQTIGLAELRSALGFGPSGPWKKYKSPSQEEIANVTTLEEYLALKEPLIVEASLNSEHLFETNAPPAVRFMDKRFPAIREIFREKFKKYLGQSKGGIIDRKTVDDMFSLCKKTYDEIESATSHIPFHDYEC